MQGALELKTYVQQRPNQRTRGGAGPPPAPCRLHLLRRQQALPAGHQPEAHAVDHGVIIEGGLRAEKQQFVLQRGTWRPGWPLLRLATTGGARGLNKMEGPVGGSGADDLDGLLYGA